MIESADAAVEEVIVVITSDHAALAHLAVKSPRGYVLAARGAAVPFARALQFLVGLDRLLLRHN